MKNFLGRAALTTYAPKGMTEQAVKAANEQLANVYKNKFADRARAASRPQA